MVQRLSLLCPQNAVRLRLRDDITAYAKTDRRHRNNRWCQLAIQRGEVVAKDGQYYAKGETAKSNVTTPKPSQYAAKPMPNSRKLQRDNVNNSYMTEEAAKSSANWILGTPWQSALYENYKYERDSAKFNNHSRKILPSLFPSNSLGAKITSQTKPLDARNRLQAHLQVTQQLIRQKAVEANTAEQVKPYLSANKQRISICCWQY